MAGKGRKVENVEAGEPRRSVGAEARAMRATAEAGRAPPWRHALAVETLPDEEIALEAQPAPDDLPAIARYLGVDRIEGPRLDARIAPWGKGGRILTGTARATVHQTCVVTLEPLETAIAEEVERRYLPGLRAPDAEEIELDADADREPEPLGPEIELGDVLLEALGLAIDPWPRAEGAEHGTRVYAPPGAEPLDDEAVRPFAGLEALRRRMSGGEDG